MKQRSIFPVILFTLNTFWVFCSFCHPDDKSVKNDLLLQITTTNRYNTVSIERYYCSDSSICVYSSSDIRKSYTLKSATDTMIEYRIWSELVMPEGMSISHPFEPVHGYLKIRDGLVREDRVVDVWGGYSTYFDYDQDRRLRAISSSEGISFLLDWKEDTITVSHKSENVFSHYITIATETNSGHGVCSPEPLYNSLLRDLQSEYLFIQMGLYGRLPEGNKCVVNEVRRLYTSECLEFSDGGKVPTSLLLKKSRTLYDHGDEYIKEYEWNEGLLDSITSRFVYD